MKNFNKFYLLLLLILYTYALAKPIDLAITDIGRHLINGREVLSGNFSVLTTNLYSYTLPDQPFINHHWLAGVWFWLAYLAGGWLGLHLFHTGLLIIFLGLFWQRLVNKTHWASATLTSLVAVIFMASRTEIRPESFGLIGLMLFLLIIDQVTKTKQLTWSQIAILLTSQLLWTNLHISFIFGPVSWGLFWLVSISDKSLDSKLRQKILAVLLGLGAVALLNPHGLAGSLAPITIFQNYGYRVFENQNLWFLRNYYKGPILGSYLLISLTSFFLLLFPQQKSSRLDKSFALMGIGLGFIALRNIPLLVVFTLPFLAEQLAGWLNKVKQSIKIEQPKLALSLVLITAFIFATSLIQWHPFFGKLTGPGFKFGLIPEQVAMLAFLNQLPATKVIFNNYDVGSALIFANYPDSKVFVDNRPEAFTAEFFQNIYIPAQNNQDIWQQVSAQYGFNYIIFGHRDITDWSQIFLRNRLADKSWKIIYLDPFLIIFAKDIPANQPIIEKYQREVPLSAQ